jgi:hypothetical protein
MVVTVVLVTGIFSKHSLDVEERNPSNNMIRIQMVKTNLFANQNAQEVI